METLLITGAVISLLLAVVMTGVAWRLLRGQRERSAARVAALEALAMVEPEPEMAPAPAPRATPPRRRADDPVPPSEITDDIPELMEFETEIDVGDVELDRPAVAPRPRPTLGKWSPLRPRPAAIPEVMFGATNEPGAPGRRWVSLALVVAVAATGLAGIYAARSTDALARLRTTDWLRGSPAPVASPLELLSLSHGSDADGAFRVTGLVQNPTAGDTVSEVVAVIYLFDREGRYVASGRAPLTPSALHPGEESPFVVTVPNAGSVGRYRVGFRFAEGGVVSHVDRRGSPPVSTTSGSLDIPAASIPASRVEGN